MGFAPDLGRRGKTVQAAQQAVVDALRLGRLRVILVVDRDVVEDILAACVHPLDSIADDGRQLVCERRVVGAQVRHGRGQDLGLPVVVLETLAGQRGSPCRRAHQEAAAAGVSECPHLVTGSLEPEHRVEDVERDRGQAVTRIRRCRGLEAGHRTRL